MKKTLIIACIVLVALSFLSALWIYMHKGEKTSTEEVTEVVFESDNITKITISAAGDCTLGTDEKFEGTGNFPSESLKSIEDYTYFFSGVRDIFMQDDITIVNLEGPLSKNGERADKEYAFRGDPEYVKAIASGGIDAVCIANNHTMDYGIQAYNDTKNHLLQSGVSYFGSDDIAYFEVDDIKIALLGINALSGGERAKTDALFEKAKSQNPDLIIASFHWGIENEYEPAQDQIALAHRAIDNGADLVLGHHPHVIQGIECYKGKYIVYSLGNFCFGGNKNPADKDSMIFRQTFMFEDGTLLDTTDAGVIPCSISSSEGKNDYRPTPLFGSDAKNIEKKIKQRSEIFENDNDTIKFYSKIS